MKKGENNQKHAGQERQVSSSTFKEEASVRPGVPQRREIGQTQESSNADYELESRSHVFVSCSRQGGLTVSAAGLLWFCFALDPEVSHYTQHSDLHQIAQDYCSRHDAAIQEEISARRPGRPKSKKQETLEFQRAREQGEYDGAGGFRAFYAGVVDRADF